MTPGPLAALVRPAVQGLAIMTIRKRPRVPQRQEDKRWRKTDGIEWPI